MNDGITIRTTLAVVASASLIAVSDVATAEGQQEAYRMGVLVDAAEGRSVQNGQYERAIERLASETRHSHGDEFARQTNLCVAYTKTGALEKANIACNNAVESIANADAESERMLALALLNRGVLHALQDRKTLARKDFQLAYGLRGHVRLAKNNLARLEKDVPTQS